jgi:lysophospholipase L1-like esterase
VPTSRWSAAGAATATALGLVAVALVRYTSFADRRVLGRWSLAHFALIVIVLGLLAWVLYRMRARRASASGRAGWVGQLGALGCLVWSAGFALDSLEDPSAGGRIFDARIFSSTAPVSILLEWVAMTLLSASLVLLAARLVPPHAAPGTGAVRAAHNLLLVVASVLGALLLIEGGLRLVAVLAPHVQGFPTRAQAGWIRRFVQLNSLGYRDVERAPAPPEGVSRILLVGDSFAFGFGIDDPRRRVGDLLEHALNQAAGARRFEIVQAGRPNTHTLHHIEALRRLLALRPRYVVLLYVFNDIDHVVRPTTRVDGGLKRVNPLAFLTVNSVAVEQVLVLGRRAMYARVWNVRDDVYMHDPVLAEHMRALARFFQTAREAGTEARLVPIDLTVILEPRFVARYQRLAREAAAHGIPVWSLERTFEGHQWPALVVNRLDNHPNELAHALTARAIAEHFRADFGVGAAR